MITVSIDEVIGVCNSVERKMHALFAFARMDFAMGAVDSLCKSGGHVLRLGGASGVTRTALPHRSAGSEQRFDPITCRNLSSNQQCVFISLSLSRALHSVTWLNSDSKCFHEFHRTHETRVREILQRDSQLDFLIPQLRRDWLREAPVLRPLRNWAVDCFGSRRKNQSMFEQFTGWLVLICH